MCRIANGLREHGPPFGAWADLCGDDSDALDGFDDAYMGHWDSITAYGEYLLDDLGYADLLRQVLPAWMLGYVRLDPDQLFRDLDASGQIATAYDPEGGIWIFDNNLR